MNKVDHRPRNSAQYERVNDMIGKTGMVQLFRRFAKRRNNSTIPVLPIMSLLLSACFLLMLFRTPAWPTAFNASARSFRINLDRSAGHCKGVISLLNLPSNLLLNFFCTKKLLVIAA